MHILSNPSIVALVGVAILSSCSRPVAYFQPTEHEHFTTQSPPAKAVNQGMALEANHVFTLPVEPASSPVDAVVGAKQAVSQLEAQVRNDAKLGSSRKLAKRLVRLNEVLATASKQSITPAQVTVKKVTFVERTMLKRIDKKIRQQLVPDQAKAMNSNIRLGIIIGVIGLILLLIGSGVLTALGIIGLVVGIVLIVLGYLNS